LFENHCPVWHNRENHFIMKKRIAMLILGLGLLSPTGTNLIAADLVKAKDGSGVYGYDDTPVLPWCGFRVHDADRPAPKRINPGTAGQQVLPATPPADAIVLFDGKDLSKWTKPDYKIVDDCLEAAGGGNLTTKDSFGNCQIHLEWMAPSPEGHPWYNRGNNGVFLMGLYEIQIFDSFTEKIYPDGMAAAIYGQTPPLVNVCLPPGQWQSYDMIFTAPVFVGDKLVKPARLTMFHNGVLVHLNEEIRGETGHRILPAYKKKVNKGPLVLGGHNCPVRFRNIWIRPL
jgi:hypothetical protein